MRQELLKMTENPTTNSFFTQWTNFRDVVFNEHWSDRWVNISRLVGTPENWGLAWESIINIVPLPPHVPPQPLYLPWKYMKLFPDSYRIPQYEAEFKSLIAMQIIFVGVCVSLWGIVKIAPHISSLCSSVHTYASGWYTALYGHTILPPIPKPEYVSIINEWDIWSPFTSRP